MSAKRKVAKLHIKRLQAASKKAKACEGEPEVEHALKGKTVRVCAPGATLSWRNGLGTLQKVQGATATVLMQGTAALSSDFPCSQLYLITGKEKQSMVAKLDYRRVLLLQKLIALKETGDTQFVVSGVYLEGPEVTAFWHQVLVRGSQSGDCFDAGQTVYVEPHAGKVAVQAHLEEAFSEEAFRSYKDLQERLQVAPASEYRCLILCPIQSDGPKH